MSDTDRIEFDATLDEIADVNMRLVRRTKTYRRCRSQWQWAVGALAAGVAVVNLQEHVAPAVIAGAGVVSGVLSGYLYGRVHELLVRQSYTRMVRELYGGAPTVPCVFELRDRVLWAKAGTVEMSFPWSDRVSVNDAGDCVEVWFNPGLAVVRNRAFHSDADRKAFLDVARTRS